MTSNWRGKPRPVDVEPPRTDVTVLGEAVYDTPGTYTWVCPTGVTSVCAVAIGAGGTGYTNGGPGGSGGALSYRNNITVVPGNSYTVVVGSASTTSSSGTSYFSDFGVCGAQGGSRASRNGNNTIFSPGSSGGIFLNEFGGDGGDAGGGYYTYGGGGGGGAGGYLGEGGAGGAGGQSAIGVDSVPPPPLAFAGGGGGGGGSGGVGRGSSYAGSRGGGTGLYGIVGVSGKPGTNQISNAVLSTTGGDNSPNPIPDHYDLQLTSTYSYDSVAPTTRWGNTYGGGAGSTGGSGAAPAGVDIPVYGAQNGAVRIVWGENVSYPYNAVQRGGRLLTDMVTGAKYGYPDGAMAGKDLTDNQYYVDLTNFYQWHSRPSYALGPYRYIKPALTSAFRIGPGSVNQFWTIEMWVWWDGTNAGLTTNILSLNGKPWFASSNRSMPGGLSIEMTPTGSVTVKYAPFTNGFDASSNGGLGFGTLTQSILAANQWNHIAMEFQTLTNGLNVYGRGINGYLQFIGISNLSWGAASTDGGWELDSITIGDRPEYHSINLGPLYATGGANHQFRVKGVRLSPSRLYNFPISGASGQTYTPIQPTSWTPSGGHTILRVV